ncbi:MAG: 30S ribosomal protein S15 [Legionellales bacterium]|nr:30S ribosomal protein S15 [Legionellales bacterium]|tara:strand:- start:84037 stop:84303 length:267 start_codon:yes stop_codon:yes gene_type:complete
MLSKTDKANVVKENQSKQGDTGSPQVQIALLTARIKDLQGHFDQFKKDNHSRRGLMKMVAQRRKLMKYLKKKDLTAYRELLQKLGIRG